MVETLQATRSRLMILSTPRRQLTKMSKPHKVMRLMEPKDRVKKRSLLIKSKP